MTWREFIDAVDGAGVMEADRLDFIDVLDLPDHELTAADLVIVREADGSFAVAMKEEVPY